MSEQGGLVNVVRDRMAIDTSKRLLVPLLSILNVLNVSNVPVQGAPNDSKSQVLN